MDTSGTRPRDAPHPGEQKRVWWESDEGSQQAGQAGVGPVLCLELHWGRAVRPRDEVVFREAAGLDVVLEQLLREILVHLGGLMGIDGVATGFVQVSQQGR